MKTSSNKGSIQNISWDVVVIGAGAAGLMSCLEIPSNLNVLLLNRNTSKRSASRWAQGGIAAVTRVEDSLDSHIADTLKAGAGLCDLDAVQMLVNRAPQCVQRLQQLGMQFDSDSNGLCTTLEAAHSFRRVLHVQDRTGRALIEVLREQVEKRANVLHKRGVRVTQLWVEKNVCKGVQVLDGPYLYWIPARAVVLATGGGGHLFVNTTNPAQACGEGLALAWKAGAFIEDLEFVQFHPTALKLQGAQCFLITEALRGEGAQLVDQNGNSPVESLSKRDLSPRDQVSRALVERMNALGVENLGLDLRSIPIEKLESRFPTILQRCKELGIDPLESLVPVAPAAHYWMGGVFTNLNAETSVNGLYAVGEVACTGVHGANRLASNSLMECLVFAGQLSSIKLNQSFNHDACEFQDYLKCSVDLQGDDNSEEIKNSIKQLRQMCWDYAGVNRSIKGMSNALSSVNKDFHQLMQEPLLQFYLLQSYEVRTKLDESSRKNLNLLLDLRHRLLASSLLFKACLFREESRGGHFRNDSPESLPYWECHSRQRIGDEMSTRPVKR